MSSTLTCAIAAVILQNANGVKHVVRTTKSLMQTARGLTEEETELMYLAGDVSNHNTHLKQGILEGMGWDKGTTIHDGNSGNDTAQIYKKNRVCAIAFSATDDEMDELQQVGGLFKPTSFCGLDKVNGGYAQEMSQYMKLSTWSDGIKELAGCNDVWAVGHSMGGAMASLFAFCANSNNPGFQGLPEVAVMTIGSPEVSQTPLYNGEPGKCFKGVRTSVHHEAKQPSPQFYIDVATLLMHYSDDFASIKANMEDAMKDATPAAFDDLKSQLMVSATPYLMQLATTTDETILGNIKSTIGLHFVSVSIPYDPVPILWRPYGYVQPLVAYQPMPLLPGLSPLPFPRVACDKDTVPKLPKHDLLQGFLGTLLGNSYENYTEFPNHDWCNLAPNFDDCAAKRTPACTFPSCNYVKSNPYVLYNIA